MTIPLPGTTITSGPELQQFWSGLMGPDGFAWRKLWLVFLDPAGQVLPLILPFDDLPEEPDPRRVSTLIHTLGAVGADIGADTIAMAMSRPGSAAMTDADRRWARAVRTACGGLDWPFHLATRGRVQPFAPDDLV